MKTLSSERALCVAIVVATVAGGKGNLVPGSVAGECQHEVDLGIVFRCCQTYGARQLWDRIGLLLENGISQHLQKQSLNLSPYHYGLWPT